MDKQGQGLVIKAISGFYTVETGARVVVCQVPGRLKRQRQNSDLVTIGDRVTFTYTSDEAGLIEAIEERRTILSRSRAAAGLRQLTSDKEQVLIANVDQLIIVTAITNPAPSLRKLDRFLVVAEMNELPAILCVNKVDLTTLAEAEQLFALYEQIGYPVLYTSAKTGQGIDALREKLQGKISVFSGSSGVGKSSLLNAMQPDLGLKVHQVSQATGKGLHTTRYAEMFPLEGGGYVADTPGIRGLALFDLEPTEIDGYFREIAPLVADCPFSDCTHRHEPGCAVVAAVKRGDVAAARYDSYLRLREEHEALERGVY